jgi:mannose-6-phosphate isomerase
MTIEHAHARSVPKPWGIADARPWSTAGGEANTIGEIWYDRSDSTAIPPSLLLKLLFTSKPLSIQVHPDDKFAISIGQPRGKSEAWYILSAAPEAQVALGLKQQITLQQLRAAVDDGSISTLVAWHTVSQGEIIFVLQARFTRLVLDSSSQRVNIAPMRRFACSITAASESSMSTAQ